MKNIFTTLFVLASIMGFTQTTMNIYQSNGTVLQIPLSTIDSITYTVGNPGNLAALTTLSIGSITSTSAVSGGDITSDGGAPITQRGVCYGTSTNPTTADSTTNDGSGTGSFSSNLSGLTANTSYYVRSYAINSAGTAYGNEVSFTTTGGGIVTNPGSGVTDIDGNIYTSIVLGNGQEWMQENLRTTKYANGDTIPNVTDSAQWFNLTTDAWCHYSNDSLYENSYGKMYNWYAVDNASGLCPTGWHVPTDAEWTTLIDYLGGGIVAGGKMKTVGTIQAGTGLWNDPNTAATNESGFSGLPGGNRSNNGNYTNIGDNGYWWSSTQSNTTNAWYRALYYNYSNVYRGTNYKEYGFSVRCLRD